MAIKAARTSLRVKAPELARGSAPTQHAYMSINFLYSAAVLPNDLKAPLDKRDLDPAAQHVHRGFEVPRDIA